MEIYYKMKQQKHLCDIISTCKFSIPSCHNGFIDPQICRFYENYKLNKILDYDTEGFYKW